MIGRLSHLSESTILYQALNINSQTGRWRPADRNGYPYPTPRLNDPFIVIALTQSGYVFINGSVDEGKAMYTLFPTCMGWLTVKRICDRVIEDHMDVQIELE